MTFEIEAGGRFHRVTVEPVGTPGASGGRFRVTVAADDERRPVVLDLDARRTDLGVSLSETGGGRVRDAAVTLGSHGACLVQWPHVDVSATVDGRRIRREGPGGGPASGESRVAAPMPGRVLRVLVGAGDVVTAGQGLVVVEAMKMENELRAPFAGRVLEVAVAPGDSVDAGRLLVLLERQDPPEASPKAPGLR